MLWAAILLAVFVLIGLAIQVYQSVYLFRLFNNYRPTSIKDDDLPTCAVVLCLRGCDPGLDQHIEMLLDQDYPDYHVFFVVDHPEDPALKVVQEALSKRNTTNATIRIVDSHSPSCSLICNNIGTVVPEVALDFSLIAWVDSDAATWREWLRTLVAPLVESELSLVYGNRWYMPLEPTFGSICRFIWNYGSVQQMVFFKYPWAGSLAMKSEFALLPEFTNVMKKSITNDTTLYSLAESAGMKIEFHPGIMMVNQERIGFASFFYWMSRQMVYGRLYHPTWPIVLGTGVVTAVVIGLSIILNLIFILTWNWSAMIVLFSALMIYWLVWVGLVFQLDQAIGRMVCQRGEPKRWWSLTSAVKIFLIAPCVQFLFLAGLFKASLTRRVSWRGIDYDIKGPFEIRMIEYRPYVASKSNDESIL